MENRIKSPVITKAEIPVTDELDMLSLIKVYGRNSNDCMRIEIQSRPDNIITKPFLLFQLLLIFWLLIQK